MLGHEVHAAGPAVGDDGRREALAEACRGVRERLEGVARALAELRGDIDRALGRPTEMGSSSSTE